MVNSSQAAEPESFAQEIANAIAEIDGFQDRLSDELAANGEGKAVEFVFDAMFAASHVLTADLLSEDDEEDDD